ncbi:MAG TPA: hypothetical protein VKV21_13135 [Solirubrobacteraceae bacterium]|nr:hypothetical protein [Solirubrobacteraceae bacterium]
MPHFDATTRTDASRRPLIPATRGHAPDATRSDAPRRVLTKVPQITLVFWVLKLLTTGMGEAMSDSLGQQSVPLAAAVGIFGIVLALRLQLRQTEYRAPYYWFAVMMVAVFETMVADGIRDGAGIPYAVTTPGFAAVTAVVFAWWYRSEGTLSIHSITTRRRERFYWAAVLSTFALGTAAGDLTAYQLKLGFWPSAVLFAAVFAVPAIGWWRLRWNPIFAFWFAYIVTRPLGASFADGFSKPTSGGLRLGDPLVSVVELVFFVALVTWVTVTRRDVQAEPGHAVTRAQRHARAAPGHDAPRAHRHAPHVQGQHVHGQHVHGPHLHMPQHDGDAHPHGHPAPPRLATELE